ncbi:gamma-glutamyltransferase family protein [Pseudomonas sp. S1Bt30]|uniref:Gamma-glutamyltransferase family protein n=1 Tax=Pseudomonas quebecensis TaxID=2995174 RepID=A0ABY6QLX5_9PSED|nr:MULTISPECIES: gamma-glutamyltransferase family protein [Pseudomonas]MCX4063787.1 gamma-glutamyltransferase family protein [Pseudomonas quebecensis]UZW20327.1 gamma-glutamyltransferase family protein [Pseudomonas quebecensis]UZW22254.1 gamma-glutamyltransferase family protein [Pseudomonas quebecensis]UZW27315.1 gamma-glutamyltransferase family protein [Pseudomonas quebecensis]
MLNFSAHEYPYASQRQSVFARRGMVAASQPLAAQAGIEVMQQGGNAIDAAIATAAALTVVEPTGCGLGGDAFALVWCKGQLHGLNGNGHAPAALSIEAVKGAGHERMPLYGWTPVTVPGCPSAWAQLSQRFGKLPFDALLQPAIRLARDGFPLSPVVAHQWQLAVNEFSPHRDPVLDAWFDTFLIDGRAPKAGEMFRNPAQARTLEELAATRCESLYRGALAERLDAHSRATGGYLRASDLEDYRAQWVAPIHINYRGVDVWEIPPSGQGLVALMALKILEGFHFDHRDSAQTWHRQLEAMKLAYSDGLHYITDPLHMRMAVDDLLSDSYSTRRRGQIGEQAQPPKPGDPHASGTVYLATADAEGNMVSFIQSNYHGFGSGVVLPDSGIALQNRGQEFSLDPAHANCLAPGKKTFHTIIPGFLTQNGHALGPFGVMGGYMQPQGHVQMVMNLVDFGLNPQAALDAPRWQWLGDLKVGIEHGASRELANALSRRGHQVQVASDLTDYGRGQIILRDPVSGVLCGGTEPRADAHIAVW